MKLNIKAFALTAGIMSVFAIDWCIIMAITGIGSRPYELINEIYFGFIAANFGGLVVGTLIAFVDGCVAGAAFAFLHNKLSK